MDSIKVKHLEELKKKTINDNIILTYDEYFKYKEEVDYLLKKGIIRDASTLSNKQFVCLTSLDLIIQERINIENKGKMKNVISLGKWLFETFAKFIP